MALPEKDPKAEEPGMPYHKRIVFDQSAEDQENAMYDYWLSLTPEERLANATRMILALYKEELHKPQSNRIHFDY